MSESMSEAAPIFPQWIAKMYVGKVGYATPATTALYDRQDESSRRRAVRSLHVSYWGSDE